MAQPVAVSRVNPRDGNFAMLPTDRVIKTLTDQEAWDLVNSRGAQTVGGRDPVHLALERQWFTNVAYFMGMQRVEAGEIEQLFDPNWAQVESPYIANHLVRIVMGTVSRMAAAKPQIDVLPKSTDIEDQIGAKVGDFFLKHYDDKFNFRRLRRDLGFWLTCCGNAFIETNWNPKAGKKSSFYTNPFDNSLMHPSQVGELDQQWLQEMGGFAEQAEGEIEVDLAMPFQVFTPPGYTKLEQMPWIVIEHDRSVDWLWDNYPDMAKLITPDELDSSIEAQYMRRLSSLVGRQGFSMPGRADDYSELLRIKTMWIKPSKRIPDGRKIVVSKTLVLENDKHPYRAAGLDIDFPVVHFRYCPVPGRFWGMSLVEHLLGPQREYNRTRHQVMQMRDILSAPQWLSPRNAELGVTRAEFGDIWEFNQMTGRPELVQPPAMPPIHMEASQGAIYDMQTISAQSEASQAQVPQGVRSGVAIRALQERDLSVMGVVVDDLEDGSKKVSENLLKLTDAFVSTPQMIHVYGDFRSADVMVHKGSDIRGNTRVRVAPGSMMPKSKAEGMQNVMDLLQLGALDPMTNPKDRRVILKTMEIGDAEKYFQEEDLDARRANIENQMFLKPAVDQRTGESAPYPGVNDDDDHQVHLDQHLLFKKSDAFERLPMMRKMAFEAHLAFHKEAIAQIMQTQALMAGMEGGGGGSKPREPGKPSAPKQSGGEGGGGGGRFGG